jgi:hypothetical protein
LWVEIEAKDVAAILRGYNGKVAGKGGFPGPAFLGGYDYRFHGHTLPQFRRVANA